MYRLIIIVLLSLPVIAACQQNKKPDRKIFMQSVGSIGIMGGETGVKPVFQIISGITSSNYFAGLGIGYDNYRFRSVPLFADLRANFGKKQIAFVYGDLGYNFPVIEKEEDDEFRTTNLYYGGVYVDLGFGFRHRLNRRNSFLFSVGFSRKDISNKVGYTYPCFNPPCEEYISKYTYGMRRFVTRLSWEFGAAGTVLK